MLLAGQKVKASDFDYPITQVRGTTTTSLTNNAWTTVLLQTEDYDDDGMHSTVTNTSRFTAQRAGRYEINGGVGHGAGATGRRGAKYILNGTAVASSSVLVPPVAVGSIIPARTVVATLGIGDYIELQGFQDSGAALGTLVTSENQSHLFVKYLGSA